MAPVELHPSFERALWAESTGFQRFGRRPKDVSVDDHRCGMLLCGPRDRGRPGPAPSRPGDDMTLGSRGQMIAARLLTKRFAFIGGAAVVSGFYTETTRLTATHRSVRDRWARDQS